MDMARGKEICGVVLVKGGAMIDATNNITTNIYSVYDEPMICKSMATLVRMGIKDIMVVLGGFWKCFFLFL